MDEETMQHLTGILGMANGSAKAKQRNPLQGKMADETTNTPAPKANPDEIALELMKFIAVTTGYGKGTGSTGFTNKAVRTSEEYADSLLELFERCRTAVRKEPKA
jgi:hypothetical protein